MATVSKKEKTKKPKVKQKPEELQRCLEEDIEDETKVRTQTHTVDQQQFSLTKFNEQVEQFHSTAATPKDIVSHACSIASDCKEMPNKECADKEEEEEEAVAQTASTTENTRDDSSENISLHEELLQAGSTTPVVTEQSLEPTAPVANENSSALQPTAAMLSPILAQYPILAPLEHVEALSQVVYQPAKVKTPESFLASCQSKPLTDEEMKQIYNCPELDLVQQFELEFLMNSLLETYEADPLYAALLEYYTLQSKVTMNMHDIRKNRTTALQAQEAIWVRVPVTATFSAHCGDNQKVTESVTYEIAQVDYKNREKASAALTQLFDLVCYTYTTNAIKAKLNKVKIDQIINEILTFPGVSDKAHSLTVALHKSLDAETLPCAAQLRRAITILFSFARRFSPNEIFTNDLKTWLRKLVALHLCIATKEDHWFLLFNILRCPNGVGTWAKEYLQIPCSQQVDTAATSLSAMRFNEIALQLNSPEMNHCIAILQILLLPIKKRNEYLKAFTQSQKEISDPVKEERWILIDSDGEDTHTAAGDCMGPKESDLIALLNQIPFEKLFTSALGIEKFLHDYIIEADLISANQMLKVIVFFMKLIEIFGEGMITYNNERYKQLAKRLGRLVSHTLLYVSDYYKLFIHNKIAKDTLTCERIAVEMHALMLKACGYIYRTRNLATWQYFSSLSFSDMHTEAIWQIFYYLNVGFPTEYPATYKDPEELLNAGDFWKKFNCANADSSPEDLYYLLQTFFEMANERDKVKDWELIKTISLHIFQIGFVNDLTRDICYKTSRDMLVNLTLAYEDLISCLLLQLKFRFNEIENTLFLFRSLPLSNWKPSMDSFEILSNWLLHFNFKTPESSMARVIISHLNWGFDCDGRLFLPHNIHVRMACLVGDALTKHAPELVGLSTISESVRQVSNLMDFTQSTKEQFSIWCWSMVSLLRLHSMDQSVEAIKRTLQNPQETLIFVPELERIDLVYQGVSESRPLALYTAILISLHGHSIPLICQKGFELIKLLLNDYRHAAVVRCIELIVPLFLETPETLANCKSFHTILKNLLNADRTYLKMAKDIMYPNSVGPVLELLDNMIHHQITTYTKYGLSSPLNLINVWLNCLTSLPYWQYSNVVYLLDKLLRVAYQFSDARSQAVEYFRNYYKDCEDWKGVKMSTLKTLFGAHQSLVPALSPQYGWLDLVLLEVEFSVQDALFWPEFLRQVASNKTKGLEAILKKTASVVKFTPYSATMLVIFKYANLVASMDINHPVFPIICQKFFELYLSRLPMENDDNSFTPTYGVSDKFYEFNLPLMKKIKTNIKAAETYYSNEAVQHVDAEVLNYFYRNCADMMKTYGLWLEETSINKQSREQFNYPPQYNLVKLQEILNGNTSHWTEFIYLRAIRKEQKYQADQWARKCFRLKAEKRHHTPLATKEKLPPLERIKRHLSSYEHPVGAPQYTKPLIAVPHNISGATLKLLRDKLNILSDTAANFNLMTGELNSLNQNFLDNIVELYNMVPYEQVKYKNCSTLLLKRTCTSPACITTILKHIRTNDAVQRKLDVYHERHDSIIDGMIKWNVDDFAQCYEQLNTILRVLLAEQATHAKCSEMVTRTGVKFFYWIVKNMTDITMKFPPTHDLYTHILGELGIFIHEDQEQQGYAILELALKRPDLIKVLAGVFVPYRTRPEYFLKMYKFLIDSYLKRSDAKILFVLLSKFDLVLWLEAFHPKFYETNTLLELVLHGLECWSQPDSSLLQDQFRRHLVHLFNYDFPEHYGEVLQKVLDRVSEQKLMPEILLDLLNSLLERFNCEAVSLKTSIEQIKEIAMQFARTQNLFNLKAASDTIMLFARHFQKERLNHGLHGLYPKHKNYCAPLAMWFSCFSHTLVVTAICTYQSLLADQIIDVIFGSIIEMYSPWLVVYTEQNMQQPTSNWIRQLSENGKMLLPWSEQHAATSEIIINPFIDTLCFILESLPSSHKILNHTFSWYVHHFSLPNIDKHIFWPIHKGIAILPWERFTPQITYIDMLYDSVQKFIPDSHAMLGHIFIRINWNAWFAEYFPTVPPNVQSHVASRLFVIFIKFAYEPTVHIHTNTSKILEDAINYPWYLVDYTELENLFNWFRSTMHPSIILKMPTETNYADRAVLDLIRLTCAMMPEMALSWKAIMHPSSNAAAKRILYTRLYVRLLFASAAKNNKLLMNKDSLKIFNVAFSELLNTMDKAMTAIAASKTVAEQNREALNLMVEIIVPMQNHSEEASNVLIDGIILAQANTPAGSLLMCNILNAIGQMKAFIVGTYTLLEATIAYYFRKSEESNEWHTPTWHALLQTLSMSLDKLELMPIIQGPYFFTMHIFILHQLEKIHNYGDQITFMQDLCQFVESLKSSEVTEPRLALVWGVIISRCCKIYAQSDHAKKPLLMLARHLQHISTQSEGWGEGLLGAIGLKKDFVTNRRKVLTRCLACVIYSLFPIVGEFRSTPSEQFNSALQEITMLVANKKYLDVKPLVVTAVGMLKDGGTPNVRDIPHLVCRLIGIFYTNCFLTTVPEVWDFNYVFPTVSQ